MQPFIKKTNSMPVARGTRFNTTNWSVVLAAADTQNPQSEDALEKLCREYWPPVYVFIRYRGFEQAKAEDLTQGFFTLLLEKKNLKAADPERGKFRSFLLASVKHYLANEWDREQAQRRGGGSVFGQLGLDDTAANYSEPTERVTPETVFERRWAATVLEVALKRLRKEVQKASGEEFDRLKGFLTGENAGVRYRDVGQELGMSEGAVKVRVHRMRKRFGQILRKQITETVADPEEVDEEIGYLLGVLSP